MFSEVLNEKQAALLGLIGDLGEYYLAGGTAIALQLGHRKSIDFDFFADKVVSLNVVNRILKDCNVENTSVNTIDEFTAIVNGVKVTFLNYPYPIETKVRFESVISMPNLLTLAATKAFTIGRRPRWKDYVDIYFLLEKFGINNVIEEAESIFKGMFSDKLFREQIVYFDDIDFTEQVDFIGETISAEHIKQILSKHALDV